MSGELRRCWCSTPTTDVKERVINDVFPVDLDLRRCWCSTPTTNVKERVINDVFPVNLDYAGNILEDAIVYYRVSSVLYRYQSEVAESIKTG